MGDQQVILEFNYRKVSKLLLSKGYGSMLLPRPWCDAHFIAYRDDCQEVLFGRLPNRLRIERRLMGKDLMLAFPVGKDYYFLLHDALVVLADKHSTYLTTNAWRKNGKYETPRSNKDFMKALKEYKL